MKHKAHGFTIVELLIVIVIIAILAAITMVAYNGIQNKAYDSAVQSDLASTYKKLQLYNSEFSTYPSSISTPADIATMKSILIATKGSYATTSNSYIYCRSDTDVAVMGRSKSGTGFYVGTNGSGKVASASWSSGSGTACPTAGVQTSDSGYWFLWFYANNNWSW